MCGPQTERERKCMIKDVLPEVLKALNDCHKELVEVREKLVAIGKTLETHEK